MEDGGSKLQEENGFGVLVFPQTTCYVKENSTYNANFHAETASSNRANEKMTGKSWSRGKLLPFAFHANVTSNLCHIMATGCSVKTRDFSGRFCPMRNSFSKGHKLYKKKFCRWAKIL